MTALTAEQRMLVESVHDLAENEFAESAYEWEGDLPWENIEILAERDYVGINFPEAYGGAGLSEYEVLLMIEAVGRICPDTASLLLSLHMVAPRAVEMFGSETVKERYLPGICDGDTFLAIAISEPSAGSDVSAMKSTIQEDETGDLRLNGEKLWVSDVPDADAAVVWAKFDEGLGTVIVDLDATGVTVGEQFTNMAGDPQSQLFFDDVHITREEVLVRGREAFSAQLQALNWERLGIAHQANIVAGCALEKALGYADDRTQFGQSIGEFQGIEWKLADGATMLEASRALCYRVAETATAAERPPTVLRSAIAKLQAVEMAEKVTSEALQIHGANGYQQGHPLEYLYRLVRGYRIAGGTDEILKNQISRQLKEQGVPSVV